MVYSNRTNGIPMVVWTERHTVCTPLGLGFVAHVVRSLDCVAFIAQALSVLGGFESTVGEGYLVIDDHCCFDAPILGTLLT